MTADASAPEPMINSSFGHPTESDEPLPEIKKTFCFTFFTLIRSKLLRLLKRNLWLYLIAASLGSVGLQLIRQREPYTVETLPLFIKLSVALLILSMSVILLSSIIFSISGRNKRIIISFKEDEIVIHYEYAGEQETKSWDWIRSVDETKKLYYLNVFFKPKYLYGRCYAFRLTKSGFTEGEKELFNRWLVLHGKISRMCVS